MYKNYSQLGEAPLPNRDLYSVLEIQNRDHKNNLLNTNRVVVVDVYADWCGPCKQTAPQYASLCARFNKEGDCVLVKENLDKKLTQVEHIPVFLFYVDGKQVDQVVGADLEKVESTLKNILDTAPQQTYPSLKESMTGPSFKRDSIRKSGNAYNGQNFYD